MYWGHFLWERCGHWSSTPVSGLDRVAGGEIDSPVRSTAVECLPQSPRGRTKLLLRTQPCFRYSNASLFFSICVFKSRLCSKRRGGETICAHNSSFNVAIFLLGVYTFLLLTFHLTSCEPRWTRAWPHAAPRQRPHLALAADMPPEKQHSLPLFSLRRHV